MRYKKIININLFLFFFLFSTLSALEIKPGLVITRDNYKNYQKEMEKLMIKADYISALNGLETGKITMPIIKKQKYPVPKGYGAATAKYGGKCKVSPNNELAGWVAGIPFVNPKTGAEIAWNVFRRAQVTDQMSFYSTFMLYNSDGRKKGETEREFKMHLYNRYFVGRHTIPPVPEVPGNNGLVRLKESIIITEPFDIKGFAMVRLCYDPIDKPDDVFSYIPAIRRIRRLTGKDVTDPLLGCDACYDDFEVTRQKISSKMSFKISGPEDYLVIRKYTSPPTNYMVDNNWQVEWEVRPIMLSEWIINDPGYAYKKRVIYVEKELPTAGLYGGDCYDVKGRLWKTSSMIIHAKNKETFDANCWYGCQWLDHISGHQTWHPMRPIFADPDATDKVFSIQTIIREAK
ncbi:MAG: outer membrane lipoprotein-sorting protein [Thermodesulfobacteriota bacterium]|nr:outer membrane lipoprotein-sorting protein [Thermodesulfobacteriota bacterium]